MWPHGNISHMVSGTDSQGGDELDQTVNCATYRRPMYLRGYTERTVDDTMEGLFLCTLYINNN